MLVRRYKENWQDVFLKSGNDYIQVVPRKIELVEWIFPREHLSTVLKTMYPNDEVPGHYGSPGKYGYRSIENLGLATLRKALGAKKIPKLNLKNVNPLTCRQNCKITEKYVINHLIGIREDKNDENDEEIL